MEFVELSLPGCFEIRHRVLRDERGSFVKTFHEELFQQQGLKTDFREEYYSRSVKNVLRGMHFQIPPHDHDKLVYCLEGAVLDAFVDLRKSSPEFGCHQVLELSEERSNALYLPSGIAHGFYTVSTQATLVYKTTSVHAAASDSGILWNSCGIDWPVADPIVSDRDQGFPPFDSFDSPFR